jgi:hypothetical protein
MRSRPSIALFLHQRSDIDIGPAAAGCGPGYQALADADQRRTGSHALEANACVVDRDLQDGPGQESGALA